MIIKKEFFKEIYFIDYPNRLRHSQWDNFLMCGRKNWDYYFLPFKTKHEHDIIKNAELLEFDSEKAMFRYMEKLKQVSLLNFSLDFKNPCLLKFV